MRDPRPGVLVALVLLGAPASAAAQLTEEGHEGDPLGIDDTIDLERIRLEQRRERERERKRELEQSGDVGPEPPGLSVTRGEVLDAIGGVREVDHRVDVRLRGGLARVGVDMRFAHRGKHPAEVSYRLAVPADAALASLTVCGPRGCRDGTADAGAGASVYDDAVRSRPAEPGDAESEQPPKPVAHAHKVRDERGTALRVRAAPVRPDGELTVRLSYVTAAPQHGGVVRTTLPARGRDPRAAEAAVTVRADALLTPTVSGARAERTPVSVEPWRAAEVVARVPTDRAPEASARTFRCGDRTCARVRIAAGPKPGEPVTLVLLVDASPSMEGPPRNRLHKTLEALLTSAPRGSRVRVAAFAGEARALVEHPTETQDVPVSEVVEGATDPLGAATRFERAWPLVRRWLEHDADVERAGAGATRADERETHVVIVGDGALTHGKRASSAFAEAEQMGARVSAVSLVDRSTWSALEGGAQRTGGMIVNVGAEAQRALDGEGDAALEERLSALFAPQVLSAATIALGRRGVVGLGALRAGEARVWEGAVTRDGVRVEVGSERVRARPERGAMAQPLGVRVAQRVGVKDPRAMLAAVDAGDLDTRAPAAEPDVAEEPGEQTESSCSPRGPAHMASGVSTDDAPVALAATRCETDPPDAGEVGELAERRGHGEEHGHGIPANTVRNLVRQRVIPVARRCLRRDRAGRPDYSVRAVFDFKLADREIVAAEVRGDIREPLRQCLLGALHELSVPPFRGVVEVQYPIHTERAPEPPTIDLRRDVAREVDEVAGDEPTEPPPAP